MDLRTLSAQPTVCARLTAPTPTLAELFGRIPAAVFAAVGTAGAVPAGALYARYHLYSPETVDVEIGVPVAAPAARLAALDDVAPGDLGRGELPAGKVAVAVHVGHYDGLAATYEALHAWIQSSSLVPGDAPWESYIDDPGDMSDMSGVRTEVVWPIG